MAASGDSGKLVDKIRKLFDCDTDVELAKALDVKQPQISRWRKPGFHGSTARLLERLMKIIASQKREIARLTKKDAESEK